MAEKAIGEDDALSIAWNQDIRSNPQQKNSRSDRNAQERPDGANAQLGRPANVANCRQKNDPDRRIPTSIQAQLGRDRQKCHEDQKRGDVSGARITFEPKSRRSESGQWVIRAGSGEF